MIVLDDPRLDKLSLPLCYSWTGLAVAGAILLSWLLVLATALFIIEVDSIGVVSIVGLSTVLTWLYTGLFITAHDAMHGLVAPRWPRLNRWIGQLVLTLYALFDFERLLAEHTKHHRTPATDQDPDFYDGSFLTWYLVFIGRYLTIRQLLGMAFVAAVLTNLLAVRSENLILFWVLPALLSTLQLFFFGTFLPHRLTREPFEDHHSARSTPLPSWLALISCYNFGAYHHQHHLFPALPWWRLQRWRKFYGA
jgi:beta-carotene ketolase (CrtW type)